MSAIETQRIHTFGDDSNDPGSTRGKFVLYWMQRSQRTRCNHALEHAAECANEDGVPLVVAVVISDRRHLSDDSVQVTARQMKFALEGLSDIATDLDQRKIGFVVRVGHPVEEVGGLAEDATRVVSDFGYLRHERRWRQEIARSLDRPLTCVESDLIVPIETASDKQEYAARTIRPKLHEHFEHFCKEPTTTSIAEPIGRKAPPGIDLGDLDDRLSTLDVDDRAEPVSDRFRGGQEAAKRQFDEFLSDRLGDYDEHRSHPEHANVSHMSKYLHFGHVSAIELVNRLQSKRGYTRKDKDSFIEEILVRRELTHNYVYYCRDYDHFRGLPDWARETLDDHSDDVRPTRYTRSELEDSETDDPYWNAAMTQLRETGYMHNHMRMYWGKKILQWSGTPQYAHRTALRLNNRYFLDGNDPNSFANISWCFGLHDRGWPEREIFGKVRFMNRDGLERKADPQAYVERVDEMVDSSLRA